MPPSEHIPALDASKQTDEELGAALLRLWVAHQAARKGANPLSAQVAGAIRAATSGMDGDNARNAAVEKALKRAAQGDVKGAGKILREHLIAGAKALLLEASADAARKKIAELAPMAAKGAKFVPMGRGQGDMRKLLTKIATKHPKPAKARDVWNACKASSQAKKLGIEFGVDDAWTRDGNVSFARFSNILSEIRNAR